jgi:acyl-CoA dehydrogenase family protein 9
MARLKSLGVFGIMIPKEYGGLGFTTSEYLRFTEKMAGLDVALLLVPLAHLSIGVMGLLLFGNEEQKRRYLPRAASGETIFAFALTEPQIGSDARNIQTRARKHGEGYRLTGTKTYITNANYAGAFTLFAQLDGERPGSLGAFVVERQWEGVAVGKDMPKMGLHINSTAAVMLKEVSVPAANPVPRPGVDPAAFGAPRGS